MKISVDDRIRDDLKAEEVRDLCYYYYGKGACIGAFYCLVVVGLIALLVQTSN